MPPPMDFPEEGAAEEEVLEGVRELLGSNPYEIGNNFGISYVGPPHPITRRVSEMALGTFFVEWARDLQPGPYEMEKQAVRMLVSLLGKPDAVGFITSGGTESNISALRLARNLSASVSAPEVIMPESGHYSFHIGAEMLGIRLREAPLGPDILPDMNYVESLINKNTVGLVCSAPGGAFMVIDPIEEFADLAQRKGLFLHVDGAFGGFILPFMRELGYDVPKFDFSQPSVSTMMTDGHKLGLMPVATGFFLVRDEEMLQAIPTERTVIHTVTATKHGERAASAWAVLRHLGRKGYIESSAARAGGRRLHRQGHRADRRAAAGRAAVDYAGELHRRQLRAEQGARGDVRAGLRAHVRHGQRHRVHPPLHPSAPRPGARRRGSSKRWKTRSGPPAADCRHLITPYRSAHPWT